MRYFIALADQPAALKSPNAEHRPQERLLSCFKEQHFGEALMPRECPPVELLEALCMVIPGKWLPRSH